MLQLDEKQMRRLYMALLVTYWILFSIAALSTAILPALMATDWHALTAQKQFQICLVVLGNWLNVVLALLLKTLVRMARGLPPIETGDTDHLKRTK